jgi:hypothetical protein
VIKHSLIYGPTLFKFAVNILQITTSSMGYVLLCSLTVVKTFTYLWTDSLQICWAHTTDDHKLHGLHAYYVHAPRDNCSLIYGRFLFKFGVNILHITTSSKGYVLFMFTHRAHACERACTSARVVKQSIIFGRILFKFDGHILQLTTSYMGYILIMFNHCVRACASVRVRARV